jgi:hypothetical protein
VSGVDPGFGKCFGNGNGGVGERQRRWREIPNTDRASFAVTSPSPRSRNDLKGGATRGVLITCRSETKPRPKDALPTF